jgi:hypothetical protein
MLRRTASRRGGLHTIGGQVNAETGKHGHEAHAIYSVAGDLKTSAVRGTAGGSGRRE